MAFPMPKIADPNKKHTKGSEDRTYTLCPAGLYSGVLVRVYYVGDHKPKSSQFGDKDAAPLVILVFELDELETFIDNKTQETIVGDRNRLVSIWLTLYKTLGDKSNAYKLIKQWLGNNFPKAGQDLDIPGLVGVPAMVTITHNTSKANGKVYANISGLAPLMRGMQPFTPTTKLLSWSIGDPITEDIPQYILDKCDESVQSVRNESFREPSAASVANRLGGSGTKEVTPQSEAPWLDKDDDIPY